MYIYFYLLITRINKGMSQQQKEKKWKEDNLVNN